MDTGRKTVFAVTTHQIKNIQDLRSETFQDEIDYMKIMKEKKEFTESSAKI